MDDLFARIAAEDEALSDDGIDPYLPVIPDSDSDNADEPLQLVQDTESEDEEDEVVFDYEQPANYFLSKDKPVRWAKRVPRQQGRVAATNIVDRIGPKGIVP